MIEFLKEELGVIRGSLMRLTGSLLGLSIIFFAVPLPGGHTTVEWALQQMRAHLVPESVSLIIINPLDSFIVQVNLAVILAIIFCAPLLLLEIWRFVSPGLYVGERLALGVFFLASLLFWAGGAAFSYFVLVPAVFGALYIYVPEGVAAYFSLRELVSLTAGLTLATSLLFLLPVGMAVLSAVGAVSPAFWRSYARHAILIALVASAIITPDGSGITMALLALPICGLYAVGWAGSRVVHRGGSNYQQQHI